jgi:hypothetical protein
MPKLKTLIKGWLKDSVKPVRFSDGRVYQLNPQGAMRRVFPSRPWHGKTARRSVILRRRLNRALDGKPVRLTTPLRTAILRSLKSGELEFKHTITHPA